MRSLSRRLVALVIAVSSIAACVNYVPLGPSDAATEQSTTTSSSPTPTPTPTPTAVAYTQDLQPIFATDCIPCHGSSRPAGRYSMTSYAGVMAAVRAGSVSSALVMTTQPGASCT